MDGRIGSVHTEKVFIPGFGCFQPGLCVFTCTLRHLLLDHFVFTILLQFLLGYLFLDFSPLFLHNLELGFGLPELGLVGVMCFHGCVQFMEDFQNLFMDLKSNLAALKREQKLVRI